VNCGAAEFRYWIVSSPALPIPTSEASQAIPTDEPTPRPTFTPTASPPSASSEIEPRFGEIEFAEGFRDGNPVRVSTQFPEGITEVHAVFEHYGMSPDYTWKRVWYRDGNVLSENSAKWEEAPQGIFDAFLEDDGRALPAGTWRLELYCVNFGFPAGNQDSRHW
jgi:hypothetical protein